MSQTLMLNLNSRNKHVQETFTAQIFGIGLRRTRSHTCKRPLYLVAYLTPDPDVLQKSKSNQPIRDRFQAEHKPRSSGWLEVGEHHLSASGYQGPHLGITVSIRQSGGVELILNLQPTISSRVQTLVSGSVSDGSSRGGSRVQDSSEFSESRYPSQTPPEHLSGVSRGRICLLQGRACHRFPADAAYLGALPASQSRHLL